MKLYLTSSPTGSYRSNEPKTYKGFNPENQFVRNLQEDWKPNSRCLLIAADPYSYEGNDEMLQYFKMILEETELIFESFEVYDARADKMKEYDLLSYDFLMFGGGHVPTQNRFLHEMGVVNAIKHFDGIVMGISAGSMNAARMVYAQPEMPGESSNPAFQKFIPGLGLTDTNILPHYQAVKHDWIDGKRLYEDITYNDSYGHKFYSLVDGSYLLNRDGKEWIYGKAYLISEGAFRQINWENEVIVLK